MPTLKFESFHRTDISREVWIQPQRRYNSPLLYTQYRDCWWPRNARRQEQPWWSINLKGILRCPSQTDQMSSWIYSNTAYGKLHQCIFKKIYQTLYTVSVYSYIVYVICCTSFWQPLFQYCHIFDMWEITSNVCFCAIPELNLFTNLRLVFVSTASINFSWEINFICNAEWEQTRFNLFTLSIKPGIVYSLRITECILCDALINP